MTTFDKTGREVHGMSWERHGHIMCKSRARDLDRSREGRMSWHGYCDNPVRVNWGLYLVQSTLSRLYFKNIFLILVSCLLSSFRGQDWPPLRMSCSPTAAAATWVKSVTPVTHVGFPALFPSPPPPLKCLVGCEECHQWEWDDRHQYYQWYLSTNKALPNCLHNITICITSIIDNELTEYKSSVL